MLIQCLCQNKSDALSSVTMLISHFQQRIKFLEVSVMTNINEDFSHVAAFETKAGAFEEVDNYLNMEYDNIGVYYNDGEKIYIRIYKNAKVDPHSYKYI